MVRHARRAAAVSIAGIAVPFALGAALALLSDAQRRASSRPRCETFHAVLFVGAAMSITAFPVLARIIYERGIAGTAIGSLALAAGAMDDAAAWVILAIVLGSFTGNGTLAVVAAVGGLLYAVVRLRRRAPPASRRFDAHRGGARRAFRRGCSPTMLAALAAGAWFTDLRRDPFGVRRLHARRGDAARTCCRASCKRVIEPLTTALLLPLFFVYSGLNTPHRPGRLGVAVGGGRRRVPGGLRRQRRGLLPRRPGRPARRPARR